MEIGSGSQMVFEKPSKRCALEEVVSAVLVASIKKGNVTRSWKKDWADWTEQLN